MSVDNRNKTSGSIEDINFEEIMFDNPDKGFFYSYNMIFDLNISEHAKILYLFLCRCADSNKRTFPSYATMAKCCGFSRSTAIRVLKILMEEGLLIKKRRCIPGKGEQTSNIYLLFSSPREDLKQKNTKQLKREKEEYRERLGLSSIGGEQSLGSVTVTSPNSSTSQEPPSVRKILPSVSMTLEVQPNEVQPNEGVSSSTILTFAEKYPVILQRNNSEIVHLIQHTYDKLLNSKSRQIAINKAKVDKKQVIVKYQSLTNENIEQVINYVSENRIKSISGIASALYNSPKYTVLAITGTEEKTNKKKNSFFDFNQREYSKEQFDHIEETLCFRS